MDFAGTYRSCDFPLWANCDDMARLGQSAISSSNRRGVYGNGAVWHPDHRDPVQTSGTMGLVYPVVLSHFLVCTPVRKPSTGSRSYSPDCIHPTFGCQSVALYKSVLSTMINPRIPELVRPTLENYLRLTNEQLPGLISAFYIVGSIALD